MKNIKKLTAYVLASSLLLSNITMLPAYAKDESILNKQSDEKTTDNLKDKADIYNATFDFNSLKVDKKDISINDSIHVTLNAPEDISNIRWVYVVYKSPITANERYSIMRYNETTNQYETNLSFYNPYTEHGIWEISQIYVTNKSSQTTHIYSSDYDFSNGDFNVNNDNDDYTPPTVDLNSLRVEKKCIKPGEQIKGSFKATDDNSGIGWASISYTCSTTSEKNSAVAYYNPSTDLYEFTLDTDENLEDCDYIFDFFQIEDCAANSITMKADDYDFSKINIAINNGEEKHGDTTAPTVDLDSLKIDKNNVTVNDTVNVSLKADDDKSGVGYIEINYKAPLTTDNKSIYLFYNDETNLYEGSLKINDYMENGTWSVNYIELCDMVHNSRVINSSDYDFSSSNFNVNGSANIDNIKPTIDVSSIKVNKKEVNANDTVNISLSAFDDKSGIKSITVEYKCKLTNKEEYIHLNYNQETKLYEGTLTIDPYMDAGIWSMTYISATDNSNNTSNFSYYNYDFSNYDINITNTKKDTTPPTVDLSSLKVDKKDVKLNDKVTISLKATDAETGINSVNIKYKSKLTNRTKGSTLKYNSETGLYESTLDIDNYMGKGIWSITDISISDNSKNATNMSSADYDFSNADFNVINDDADITPPALDINSIKLDKKEVKHGDTINVSYKVYDKSKVITNCMSFKSKATGEIVYVLNNNYNPKTDCYEGNIYIDDHMAAGTWTINEFSFRDEYINDSKYLGSDYNFSYADFNVIND